MITFSLLGIIFIGFIIWSIYAQVKLYRGIDGKDY